MNRISKPRGIFNIFVFFRFRVFVMSFFFAANKFYSQGANKTSRNSIRFMIEAHGDDVYHIWQPLGKQQSFLVYSKELGYKNRFVEE